ncbi:hypothetical protein Bca4012_004504 [Brassica carinata]
MDVVTQSMILTLLCDRLLSVDQRDKGQWFRLIRIREIEIENRKRRAQWGRTEASNRRSILSKRKRRPDLLTPPASSLFHWSFRRRVFANRKVAASNREVAASKSQSTSII